MNITVKGVTKTVKIGDSVKLVTGEIALVTGSFGKAMIVRTDMNEVRVVEPKDIIDIIVEVVQKSGLFELFIAWIKRKLG